LIGVLALFLTGWTTVEITAYCPERVCVGANISHGLTKMGIKPVPGVTLAVDPKKFPLDRYWELCFHVDGVEECHIVHSADTGRLIKGKRVDLFLPNEAAATRFGIRNGRIRPYPAAELVKINWRRRRR
jgi:3D (Asp-Asp-Asp) domain-containing protein